MSLNGTLNLHTCQKISKSTFTINTNSYTFFYIKTDKSYFDSNKLLSLGVELKPFRQLFIKCVKYVKISFKIKEMLNVNGT